MGFQSTSVLREYGSSGEDVSVNAVIIPRNWVAIPSAILLIKCPQQIRKYTVDTSLEFKYSLANNGSCLACLTIDYAPVIPAYVPFLKQSVLFSNSNYF